MTKAITLSRPAMSAIAAFLALSAPSAFAQTASPPTPADVPAMVSPVAPPPAAPKAPEPKASAPQTAQTPAPKPVIRVPLDLPAETAEPAPKAAERPAATAKAAPARAERGTARTRSAEPAAAAPQSPAPAAALAASEAAPLAPAAMTPTEPAAALSPLPVDEAPAATATTGVTFPWEIAGGAAALLLVGGAGLAFARRRRAERDVDDAAMSYEQMAAAEAVPYSPPREQAAPASPAQTQPAMRSTPSFAAAPHGSMGRHEAMALAGPTDDNPFETLKKRLQRAHFLDRQERAQYAEALAGQKDMQRKPLGAWEVAQRDIAAPAAEQEVRRPERGSKRPGDLRPGLIRH